MRHPKTTLRYKLLTCTVMAAMTLINAACLMASNAHAAAPPSVIAAR